MSTLDFAVIDLDFPVGSKNKTATLITGLEEAFLIDAGFTRADGHRLVAAVLDSGKPLTKVFISHADPDFYWGVEVIADAFPDAEIVATPLVIDHIRAAYEAKLKAWEAVGANRPTRLVELAELTGDLTFEGHVFQLKGGNPGLPDRHYLWQAEHRAIVGGVLLFQNEHVWVADTASPEDRAVWIELLAEMTALDPAFAVPGHRLPSTTLDTSPIAYTRDYLTAFEAEMGTTDSGEELTAKLVARYPDAGMLIAAQLGAKVAKGEMTWELTHHAPAESSQSHTPRKGTSMTETTDFHISSAPANVVRRQYLASANGDLEALRATLADDVEWTEMAGFPLAGTYRTPTGVTSAVMERLGNEWDNWIAHDDTYVVDGENVVVLARYTATNKATGNDINVRVAHHFIVRSGRIVRFEQFVDTAKVRDAMLT